MLPETLFITNGASSGLDLICSLLTRPGDVIFVEEPSYFLAMQIFADHRLRLVPIPIDEHGLVVEALEDALKKHHPVFLYTIPTFQNPSGHTLSDERRRRLAQLSREHDFLIVADEVYHLLNFGAQPPTPFARLRRNGQYHLPRLVFKNPGARPAPGLDPDRPGARQDFCGMRPGQFGRRAQPFHFRHHLKIVGNQ